VILEVFGRALPSQTPHPHTTEWTIINVHTPQEQNCEAPPPAPEEDVIMQLERLGALKAQGILTEEEFQAQKAKLLGLLTCNRAGAGRGCSTSPILGIIVVTIIYLPISN
jgi:hypothetical protein